MTSDSNHIRALTTAYRQRYADVAEQRKNLSSKWVVHAKVERATTSPS